MIARLIPFALLLMLGLASPAAAQSWTQCVARAPAGTLFVGEPASGADARQVARYRAEFIKASRAAGATEADVGAETTFCFTAPSEVVLAGLVSQATAPCPTCAAPYTPRPVAWNIRDILPAELAATSTHLQALVMSQPAPPASPAGEAAGSPTAAPAPVPLASARWRALMCGAEVRVAYALETPADSPVASAPFRARATTPQGGETMIDVVLEKASAVAPTCASAAFIKVADLADFTRGLPPRGDERLAGLKQRLDDVALIPAAPATPEPSPALAAKAPVKVATATPPARIAPPAAVAQAAAAAPQQTSSAPDPTTDALNAEVNRKNAEVQARNAAAAAAYEKRMADFQAAQANYERAQRAHAAELAKAAEARAAWEAKVKACNAGDRAACVP